MKISIKQTHIDRGKPRLKTGCPISIALEEATGDRWIVLQAGAKRVGTTTLYEFPLGVSGRIDDYDNDLGMTPFEFELEGVQ